MYNFASVYILIYNTKNNENSDYNSLTAISD